MTSTMLSNSVLKGKFRGCLIGALTGDCLGNAIEERRKHKEGKRKHDNPTKKELIDFMQNLMRGESTEMLIHTGDTRMIIGLASSLADKGEVNVKDIAERFPKNYHNQTVCMYSPGLSGRAEDLFTPAEQKLRCMRSDGNAAAMRTAPVGLFGGSKGEEFIANAAKECAVITHRDIMGYRGAMLQSLAVSAALELDSTQELDTVNFISTLLEKMEKIETDVASGQEASGLKPTFDSIRMKYFKDTKPYCKSLEKMKEYFIEGRDDISSEEIAESLGNGRDISAIRSVPPAIYSFLRGMKPLKDYESENPFMRTMFFAISLGGDTDTIASMAGAIAGAYFGEDFIPDVVQTQCQAVDEVISVADKLFDATYKKE